MTTLIGGELVTPGGVVRGDLTLSGRAIESVAAPLAERADGRVFDATGLIVAPGFVDAQVNGAYGIDITTEPDRIGEVGEHLTRHGVTAFVPTIITCPPEQRAAAIGAERRPSEGAVPLGLHLEGPMLSSARRGAHPEQCLEAPSLALIGGWTRAAGIAMVTIAPELPGAIDVIRQLVADGIVVSLGHTEADARSMAAAIQAGASAVTHLFNAMSPLDHRAPGAVGATFADETVVAGLICDGIHVDPVAVAAAWHALGSARVMLVSDAMAALGLAPGRHRLGDLDVDVTDSAVRAGDGRLAGSAIGIDAAVRNLVAFTACSVAEAVGAAAATPARLLGLTDRGALEMGRRADVTVLDERLHVVATFVGGELAHLEPGEAARWS